MTATIIYGESEFKYQVVINSALTEKVRIHVYPDDSVEVEAPSGVDNAVVRAALRKRARWILEQLDSNKEAKEYVLARSYVSGETHFYLGRRHALKIEKSKTAPRSVALRHGKLQVVIRDGWPEEVRDLLSIWYQRRAKEYLSKRIAFLSDNLPWTPAKTPLKFRKMKSQWGNCCPAGTIQLNPALIRAPRECIDYVLVHELCHLAEHNHSKRFYALLDRHAPNWRHTKSKLDGMAELFLAE